MRKLTRRGAIAGVIAVPAAYLVWRAAALSADPTGPKVCIPPVGAEPENADPSELTGFVRGGYFDDVSCLNATPVHGHVAVRSERDVVDALSYARDHGLKVAAAGARHSMGGQAFAKDALILDMRGFSAIAFDAASKTVTVQPGATWHAIQNTLHPLHAVKAMQSTDIFTVGGSISVNAHGMDHQVGALMNTIRRLRVVMANGEVREIGPDSELFRLLVGGYGLFGIIVEATLDVADNVIYAARRQVIATKDFLRIFEDKIAPDPAIGLFYAHLSTVPGDALLREAILYTYTKVGEPRADLPPLGEIGQVKLRRFIINLSKRGDLFRRAKWYAEKRVEPMVEACSIESDTGVGGEDLCLVSRNEPMHDSVPYLMNALRDETDILHEYFVPREALPAYLDGLRDVLNRHHANLLNASVRVVHPEENFLSYAPVEAFSVVLYINQTADEEGNRRMAALTSDLIDLTLAHGGRFFLPYQLHYTADQLRRSYPEIGAFFAAKRRTDPSGLFSNTWYEKYSAAFA